MTFKPAAKTHPKYFPVVDREIARLQKLLAEGIAECYDDFDDYSADWGADFSWTVEASVLQYQDLLNSPEWVALAEQVKQARGYDFVALMIEDLAGVWAGEF